MFARLLMLFIFVPLADLALLLLIAKWTNPTTTILMVILSGIIGAWLARNQMTSVGSKLREQIGRHEFPSGLLTDGAMIMFAAGLLITPGLITDLFGLSLLTPVTRTWYKRLARRWLTRHFQVQPGNRAATSFGDDVVDGEVCASRKSESSKIPG